MKRLKLFDRQEVIILVAIVVCIILLLTSCTTPKGETALNTGQVHPLVGENVWLVVLLSLSGSYEIKDSKLNEIVLQEAVKKDRFRECMKYKDFDVCWKEYYPARTSTNHY